MTDILDCSNPIDGAAVRRQGYAGVARYLSRYDGPKVLKAPERDNLLAAGCTIVLVYEDNTGDALGGSGLGAENGQRAVEQARALGAPGGTCLYLACDTPEATADQVRPYYRAAASCIWNSFYRIGFYGPQAAAYALLADGTVDRAWVVETWRDGYTGDLGPFHLMQRVRPPVTVGGVECDEDAICNADYGQWGSVPSAPLPVPPAQTYPEDAMTRHPLVIATDADGNGYNDLPVSFDKVVGVFANGADPATNHAYSPIPRLSASAEGPGTRVELEDGPKTTDPAHPAQVLVFVTTAG